ncbi:hypothetical protein GAP32_075 [Cronobacter phage vB_CsaM_GAP32]|uniref:Putative membrane protein n=1 Tax=Cronobacter phage vB_CsaM_GAP32 TaxID=1141136 RepID=K4F6G8_9CAUD|nr:hypothetical protein GAP32_075 [Cronobacter phage vB_CsaM_GAP32]AFC21523.1 putative membrane protein [Cronobacter phage vB_CsaM_GAP32]
MNDLKSLKKIMVCVEVLTLLLLWVCAFYLNATTQSLGITVLTSIAMSIGSFGTGFILYEIIKEWKAIESSKT